MKVQTESCPSRRQGRPRLSQHRLERHFAPLDMPLTFPCRGIMGAQVIEHCISSVLLFAVILEPQFWTVWLHTQIVYRVQACAVLLAPTQSGQCARCVSKNILIGHCCLLQTRLPSNFPLSVLAGVVSYSGVRGEWIDSEAGSSLVSGASPRRTIWQVWVLVTLTG